MEGLDQQSLLYLFPGIVFQPNMTTGATHSRMSTIRPRNQNIMAHLFPYFNHKIRNFYQHRDAGRWLKTIPVLVAHLHCNEGVLLLF